MSEPLDVSSAVGTVLVKGCPICNNQSFRVEYVDFNHRLVCEKCGNWAWLPGMAVVRCNSRFSDR